MEPDVIRRREGYQLSFNLPYRIHDACIYPRQSSNGSNIIICAHENGLRVIWYGGRKLKKNTQPKINGSAIDLTDDDDVPAQEYEDEDEEIDPARPYHNVLLHKEVQFGISATKIAVPSLLSEPIGDFPELLKNHIIVLAACADLSLRLIAVPLEPAASPKLSPQVVVINEPNSHQDLASGIAITVTASIAEDSNTQQERSRNRVQEPTLDETQTALQTAKDWSFLIASTSATGAGLLIIHQIPINIDGQISNLPDDHIPVQRRFLRDSSVNCHIAFNPSLYPSPRHSTLLVSSTDSTATKVYQALPQKVTSTKRRGSTATTDSTSSAAQALKKQPLTDKILINLLPPFGQTGDRDFVPARKRVLDAKWILHGRAILALLDDGEWGIWDLEAAGPTTSVSASSLVKGHTNIVGIQGGSVTKFSIKGNVGVPNTTKRVGTTSNGTTGNSELAPMTPHTRKTRSKGLFQGPTQNSAESNNLATQSTQGSIAVLSRPGNNAGIRTQDECVVFSYGSTNLLVPSISSYWRSETSARGPFDSSVNARPVIMPQILTAGEEQRALHLIPQTSTEVTENSSTGAKAPNDFMVAVSSRLILFVSPLTEATIQPQVSSLPMRLLAETSAVSQDQMLLDSGELDIDGMDRILDSMANSGTIAPTASNPSIVGFGRKSVGFQLDDDTHDDEDMDMGTPTMAKSSRSRLHVQSSSANQNGARRLFT